MPATPVHDRDLRALLDVLPDAVAVLDAEGTILVANSVFTGFLGQETDSTAGIRLADLPVGPLAEAGTEAASRVLDSGRVERVTFEWDERQYEAKIEGMVSASGSTGRIAVLVEDVTDAARGRRREEQSEQRFRTLFDGARDLVFLHALPRGDEPARFLEVNQAVLDTLGYTREELFALEPRELLVEEQRPETVRRVRSIPVDTESLFEVALIARDGERIPVEAHVHAVDDGEGGAYAISIARDVRERRRGERHLRDMFESVDLAAVMLDARGRIDFANAHLAELTGWKKEEMVGLDWFDHFVPEEICGDVRRVFRRTIEEGRFPPKFENEILTRHGGRRLVRWSNTALHDDAGRVVGSASLGEDVTERRMEQEALERSQERLRALATQLSTLEDRSRRRFATALHDGVGQELAVVRMKLTSVMADAPAELAEPMKEIQALLGACIDRTRTLTYDLSPPVLYELGLEPALEAECKRITAEHALGFEFSVRGAVPPLIDELSPVLFRAVRELLLNVVKHAQATRVRVEIRRDFPFVAVLVEDDGRGFRTGWESSESARDGFGLFSIRERVRQLGGTLEVGTSSLGGAVVIVTCPLARDDAGAVGHDDEEPSPL